MARPVFALEGGTPDTRPPRFLVERRHTGPADVKRLWLLGGLSGLSNAAPERKIAAAEGLQSVGGRSSRLALLDRRSHISNNGRDVVMTAPLQGHVHQIAAYLIERPAEKHVSYLAVPHGIAQPVRAEQIPVAAHQIVHEGLDRWQTA